ncbi:hypothetical protein RDI58_026585 [Solanum bulbocastanum]|uniref:Uncharacterized protein n=1 Tax=Solanum bulbocastanum TaxID=147425 RepID=A0AAN8Y196_SOLBU
MTSSGQKCVTSERQWVNMVEEEDEHATPQKIYVSDKDVIDALVSSNVEKLISLTHINTNKQLLVGGGSIFSPNRFANLQDEDIFEEGEKEDWLVLRPNAHASVCGHASIKVALFKSRVSYPQRLKIRCI